MSGVGGGGGVDCATSGRDIELNAGGGGGGGGGIGFAGGGGGGTFAGGGGGGGYGGGGGGAPEAGGGGGSSFVTASATGTPSSVLSGRLGDGQVTISYDTVTDTCPPSTEVGPPSGPFNVTATSGPASKQITLTWTPANPNGSAITSYTGRCVAAAANPGLPTKQPRPVRARRHCSWAASSRARSTPAPSGRRTGSATGPTSPRPRWW